ncbi:MAG: hypothetical protein HW421_266 [Ignavibacteria bacterium]|nr:hypothetical protein [Ignavibacteria bacterium]
MLLQITKILKLMILLGFVVIIFVNVAQSANLNKLTIAPLNRLTLYFSELPAQFESGLTSDKKQLKIKIKNVTTPDSLKRKSGQGIIENVYIQESGKDLEIYLSLKEKKGYSAIKLPYSKAIMVEVFGWEKLSAAEDSYRSALLACESGIISTAKELLEKSINLGSGEAAGILGLINLEEGKIVTAAQNLTLAVKANVNIPDVYAGLSQICSRKGITEKEIVYANRFKEKTGLTSFENIIIPKHDEDTLTGLTLTKILESNASTDSLQRVQDSLRRVAHRDSLNKLRSKLIGNKDSLSLVGKDQDKSSIWKELIGSLLPDWFSKIFVYLLVIVFIIGVMLLYSYIKWRKRQLLNLKKKKQENSKENFKENLQTAQQSVTAAGASHAAKMYKQNAQLASPQKKKVEKPVVNQKSSEIPPPLQIEPGVEETKEELQIQDAIIHNAPIEDENSYKTSVKETDFYDKMKENTEKVTFESPFENLREKKRPISPKLELALHLQEEQKKIKKKDYEDERQEFSDEDAQKLREVAKKLGIELEKSSRGQMNKISGDDEIIQKLSSNLHFNNE